MRTTLHAVDSRRSPTKSDPFSCITVTVEIVAYWTKNRIDKLIASCFAKD